MKLAVWNKVMFKIIQKKGAKEKGAKIFCLLFAPFSFGSLFFLLAKNQIYHQLTKAFKISCFIALQISTLTHGTTFYCPDNNIARGCFGYRHFL